jgi:hypothetical protein
MMCVKFGIEDPHVIRCFTSGRKRIFVVFPKFVIRFE